MFSLHLAWMFCCQSLTDKIYISLFAHIISAQYFTTMAVRRGFFLEAKETGVKTTNVCYVFLIILFVQVSSSSAKVCVCVKFPYFIFCTSLSLGPAHIYIYSWENTHMLKFLIYPLNYIYINMHQNLFSGTFTGDYACPFLPIKLPPPPLHCFTLILVKSEVDDINAGTHNGATECAFLVKWNF